MKAIKQVIVKGQQVDQSRKSGLGLLAHVNQHVDCGHLAVERQIAAVLVGDDRLHDADGTVGKPWELKQAGERRVSHEIKVWNTLEAAEQQVKQNIDLLFVGLELAGLKIGVVVVQHRWRSKSCNGKGTRIL